MPSNALAHKLIAWVGLGFAVVVAGIGGGSDADANGGGVGVVSETPSRIDPVARRKLIHIFIQIVGNSVVVRLLFNLTEIACFIYLFIYSRISNALQETGSFDVQLAKQQHEQYCTLLREIGLDVIELPPDDALPEGVFVESSAVICNGVALIGRSENAKRRREAESMAIILKKELDIPVIEIDDPHAQLDGGDVLFTGKYTAI